MAVIGALIWKLQADIADLVKNVDQVGTHVARLDQFAGRMGTAMKGLFTVAAIRSSLEYADALDESATAAGMAVEAYQELAFAFSQSGVKMEMFQRGVQTLGDRLAGGDKSAVSAVKALGLSLDRIRSGGTEAAVMQIGDAFRNVRDPMEQARIATDLFGKSGKMMVTGLLADLTQLRAEAPKLSEGTIKSLGSANDSFDKLITSGKLLIGGVLSPLVPAFNLVGTTATSVGTKIAQTFSDAGTEIATFWKNVVKGEEYARYYASLAAPKNPLQPKPTGGIHWWGDKSSPMFSAPPTHKEEMFDLTYQVGQLEWMDELAKQNEKDWSEMWQAVIDGYVAAKEAARDFASVMRADLAAQIERQKHAMNDLTLAIWEQVAAMNEAKGLNPSGTRAMPAADTYEGAVEQATQDRDEKLRTYARQRAQLQGPSADPNSQMSRWLDDLARQAEEDYQQKLRDLWEKFLAGGQAADTFSQSTQRAAGAADRFASALAPPAGNGRSGMVTPGVTAGLSAADMAMYRASLDTIHVGNGPLRDSLIATKLAGLDMRGLGRSNVTIAPQLNISNARFTSPQDQKALADETAKAIEQMMAAQGRIW